MNKNIEKFMQFINKEIMIFPLLLTLVTVFLCLYNNESSSDFTAIVGILRLVVLMSAIFMVLFFHYSHEGKSKYSSLFAQAFISLLMGIMSLLLLKTMQKFGYVPYLIITISIYLFYSILVKLYYSVAEKKK